MSIIDLTGKRFGRLIVIKLMGQDKNKNHQWLCLCDCGKETMVTTSNLESKNTKSCGCLFKEGNNTKHGHTKNGKESGVHRSWASMVRRCNDPKDKSYSRYGARRITVCARWLNFANFLLDMKEKWQYGLRIDRIDNNKGYFKKNCRWATVKQQQRNSRNNKTITHNGATQLLIEWSEKTKIPYDTLCARIYKLDWSISKALTTPLGSIK